ncbi:hypothetical protein LSAT2_022244 [Lamellibrachia satsuma]|nr:hypothetical protein LSAT2_022244 [Lamellibrachia satsuma]
MAHARSATLLQHAFNQKLASLEDIYAQLHWDPSEMRRLARDPVVNAESTRLQRQLDAERERYSALEGELHMWRSQLKEVQQRSIELYVKKTSEDISFQNMDHVFIDLRMQNNSKYYKRLETRKHYDNLQLMMEIEAYPKIKVADLFKAERPVQRHFPMVFFCSAYSCWRTIEWSSAESWFVGPCSLQHTGLTGKEAEQLLVVVGHVKNLIFLRLGHNDLHGPPMTALTHSLDQLTHLEKLELCACRLTDEDISRLVTALPKLRRLTVLALDFNNIGDALKIAEVALTLPYLMVLRLNDNWLTEEGISNVRRAARSTPRIWLTILDCQKLPGHETVPSNYFVYCQRQVDMAKLALSRLLGRPLVEAMLMPQIRRTQAATRASATKVHLGQMTAIGEMSARIQVFLAKDSKVEDLFTGAPSCSKTRLFFSDDLFCLGFEFVE